MSKIDKNIKPLVDYFQRLGIVTTSSCQGGKGHAFPLPTVQFHIGERDLPIQKALQKIGLPFISSTHLCYQANGFVTLDASYKQIELFCLDDIRGKKGKKLKKRIDRELGNRFGRGSF